MSIEYSLLENNLTADPNDYAAHVQSSGSADLDTIIDHITDRGSKWSRSDIMAVMEEVLHVCEILLLEGKRINFEGLCEIFPRVTGVFHGATDHFDPVRHRVDVGTSPGARIRKAIRDKAKLTKVEAVKPAPAPMEYIDSGSGETNATLTPNNIGTINGHRLKFDPAKADEGIFFILVKNGAKGDPEQRVTVVQGNKPGQLIFLTPALRPGDYHVEVRVHLFEGTELRVGRLGAVLTVPKKAGGEEEEIGRGKEEGRGEKDGG